MVSFMRYICISQCRVLGVVLGSLLNQYLRLAAALGARTSGAAAGDGVTAAAATAAAAAADGAAAPSQLHGMAGNLYPVFVTDR